MSSGSVPDDGLVALSQLLCLGWSYCICSPPAARFSSPRSPVRIRVSESASVRTDIAGLSSSPRRRLVAVASPPVEEDWTGLECGLWSRVTGGRGVVPIRVAIWQTRQTDRRIGSTSTNRFDDAIMPPRGELGKGKKRLSYNPERNRFRWRLGEKKIKFSYEIPIAKKFSRLTTTSTSLLYHCVYDRPPQVIASCSLHFYVSPDES